MIVQRVSTAAFGTVGGCLGGGKRDFLHVGQFEGLHAGRVPDLGLVLEVDIVATLGDTLHVGNPFVQQLEGAEHTAVVLHAVAHGVVNFVDVFARSALLEFVDAVERKI